MARRPVNSPYSITTEFGVPDSYAKFGKHSGVDYAVPLNRPIYAPTSGQLENVVSPTGGNMVVIKANGLTHRLMHNNSFSRGNGWVNEGDEVAKAGTTGLSTGVHSHWDINKEGTYPTSFSSFVSPADWLAGTITPSGGGKIMDTDAKVAAQYVTLRGNPGTAAERAGWIGQSYEAFNAKAKAEAVARAKQITDLQTALKNEQNKPPTTVIKEVIKIVEKPVPTGGLTPEESATIKETNTIVKAIKDLLGRIFK